MPEKDILRAIRANEADPSELEHVLLNHYGQSSRTDEESTYGRKNEGIALRLRYNNTWRVTALVTGPGFTNDDEKILQGRILEQLLTPGAERIARSVLFTRVPTTGWFRFEDWLQLISLPPEAPRPGQLLAPHPLLLEVRFPSSSDHMVSMLRRSHAEREAELVCNSLINYSLTHISTYMTHHWVRIPSDANFESVLAQELYTWPSANPEADTFSNTEGIPQITMTEPQKHYTRFWISIGETLDLPADLPNSLQIYRRLDQFKKENFLRGAYWLQHAQQVGRISISAAYMALVRAVEAIMPDAEQSEKCPTCNRPQNRSVTDRFAEFVDKYAQKAVPKDNRKRFYWTRSALTHGGKLLRQDVFPIDFGPQSRIEGNEFELLSHIVKVVIHNWLVEQL